MIDLVTFKKEIENNSFLFADNLIIFIGKNDTSKFIFNQYLHTYTGNNFLEIDVLEELVVNTGFFDADYSDGLKVFSTSNLEFIPRNFHGWIFCNTASKEIIHDYDEYIVQLPVLEKWQLIDYVITTGHIELKQAEKLVNEYSDVHKLNIELQKLSMFSSNQFNELAEQLFYKDEYELFDLTNAILRRDKDALKAIYTSGIKVDVFAFIGLLIKNFKLVIDIQLSKNASAQSLGISDKQFWAVSKYNCYKYTRQELIQIYLLLTSLDLKIKTGQLSTTVIQDYVIFKIISL